MKYVKKLNKSFSRLGLWRGRSEWRGRWLWFWRQSEGEAIELALYALEKGSMSLTLLLFMGLISLKKGRGSPLKIIEKKCISSRSRECPGMKMGGSI